MGEVELESHAPLQIKSSTLLERIKMKVKRFTRSTRKDYTGDVPGEENGSSAEKIWLPH